jgi:hypothetical protein
MTIDDENRPAVQDHAAGNLLLWASGFGLGAMVVLLGFVVLIGVHVVGRDAATASSPPAAQTSAAPAASPSAGQTTGQSTAPSGAPQAK